MDENQEKLSRQDQKIAKAAALEETLANLENGTFEVYHFVGGVSDVWEQFHKIRKCNTKEHVDFVQCIECKALLSFKEASGTSHLSRHKCHRAGENDGAKFRCLPKEKFGPTKKMITNNIIKFCASDFVSYEAVCESNNFLNYAQSFVLLGYKAGYIDLKNMFPSSKHVSTETINFKEEKMRELYLNFRESLKNKWCSLTIEMRTYGSCTDRNKNKVAVMSVQYFDKDLKGMKKKFVLAVLLDNEETSENFLIKLIKEFNIFGGDKEDLQIIDIVTPNEEILTELSNFPFTRKNCYVNIITDILDEAFKVNDTLTNCRDIVNFINSAEKYNIKLSEDDGTWKSRMDMIETINKNYEGLLTIFENANQNLKFNKRKAEEIISYLALFVEAIEDLSSSSHTTANKIFLWWVILTEHLKKHENSSSYELKLIVANTKTNFNGKFCPSMDNKVDTFLDPRYKSLAMLADIEKANVLVEVRNLLEDFDDDNDRADDHPAPSAAKKGRFANFEGGKVNKEKKKENPNPKTQNRFARFETKKADLKDDDEVNIYLKLPEMDSDDFGTEFGIINQFWKQKQKLLPKLFKLATSRLHVPAFCGSVSLSRLTSKEDIKQDTINDYLFVRDNLEQFTC